MAVIPMVVAVRRNEHGDVTDVRMGYADPETNTWTPGGEPVVAPVLRVVDALMARDLVCTRMPNGTSGPGLRVVPAKVGRGVETIETDDLDRPVASFEQF
jgi:hypothetical protein